MLKSCQNNLFTRLLDLAREEDLIEYSVHLVKVEDQIQLTDIAKEGVKNLDKEMDCLKIRQLVIVGVDACAEEKARVPPVDDFVVAELDKVGLVFLVSRRYKSMDLVVAARLRVSKFDLNLRIQ